MQILVEVKDSKADFAIEVLNSMSFVKKAEPMKKEKKSPLKESIRQGLREMKLAEERKIKLKTAEELLNEL